jgi:hypothetical protein
MAYRRSRILEQPAEPCSNRSRASCRVERALGELDGTALDLAANELLCMSGKRAGDKNEKKSALHDGSMNR